MSDPVPWSELPRQKKEEFAALCDRFVGIETVDNAEKYYGNREKLIKDSQKIVGDG